MTDYLMCPVTGNPCDSSSACTVRGCWRKPRDRTTLAAGLRVVPVEATEAMARAGAVYTEGLMGKAAMTYDRMLAASPFAPPEDKP